MRPPQYVLQHYREAGIGWIISGWFKPGLPPGAEVPREPKLHVTDIRPERVLQDAPIYRCPAPAALPQAELQLAFTVHGSWTWSRWRADGWCAGGRWAGGCMLKVCPDILKIQTLFTILD
jgi:hypothetical protein